MKMDNKKNQKSQFLIKVFFGFFVFFFSAGTWAKEIGLINGETGSGASLSQIFEHVSGGGIVILGEQHANSRHQAQQFEIIKGFQDLGKKVSVGMEFFSYPWQKQVEEWRQGHLKESDFLQQIGWGKGFSFDFYRDQVLLPRWGEEWVVALNAPRSLSSKISKNGIESLSDEEKSLLPPQFSKGNPLYFERFKEAAGAHCPHLENCFLAQSLWDDTMAWQASDFIKDHSEQILVIIVGEFHAQYGGGLRDRLQARGVRDVLTVSMLNIDSMSEQEIQQEVQVSEKYGPRADYIWLSRP